METEKFIKGGRAYFIDFRGKIKSGTIYWLKDEKVGVMGLGTVSKEMLYPSNDAAIKAKKQKERRTFQTEFEPCPECKIYECDLCDAFCISVLKDGRYCHELFQKKRKQRNGQNHT